MYIHLPLLTQCNARKKCKVNLDARIFLPLTYTWEETKMIRMHNITINL